VRRLDLRERGASAIEYALLVAAVAAILIPVALALSGVLGDVLKQSCKDTARQNGITSSQVTSNEAGCG
jgi:Flp pilus assembly pilin Flp